MTRPRDPLRLSAGLEHLEDWTASAGQSERNALYRMLFSVADGTVFDTHLVLDDVGRIGEYFVLVRRDLVVKIRYPDPGSFAVLFVGSPAHSPFRDAGAV